jgi:hypothetical protein
MAGLAIRDLSEMSGRHTKDGRRYTVGVEVCGIGRFLPGRFLGWGGLSHVSMPGERFFDKTCPRSWRVVAWILLP